MSFVRTTRAGNAQFFYRGTEREDGRYSGTQTGVITYDKDDNYQISYLEVGFRSDHLVDAFIKSSTPNNIDNPMQGDEDLMRPNPVKEAVEADRAKRSNTTTDKEVATS